MRVSTCGQDLKNTLAKLQNRNVERSPAKIVNSDPALLPLIDPIGKRGGRRLVHDPENIETRNTSGIFRRLPLRIVEIGRHSDDCILDFFATRRLGISLELAQDE